jgi:hypothetical protein
VWHLLGVTDDAFLTEMDERSADGLLSSDSQPDGEYTPEESDRLEQYAPQAFAVYKAGIERLQELAPDLYALALEMEPVGLVPYRWFSLAAAGMLTDEDDEEAPGMMINVETFSTLTPDEAAFTLAHEVMHIVDKHYELDRIDDRTTRRRRGVAQDVTINDRLLARGFPRPHLPTMAAGDTLIGRDASNMTWEEVHALLPAEIPTDPGYYLRRLGLDIVPEFS